MSSHTIIVVDDEPDLAELIVDYLGRHGFAARAATDGRDLDRCMAQSAPDLLLLDVNMPGETGVDIARRIRTTSAIPIIMLTSATDMVGRIGALDLGVDDYVSKPFDLRELRARVTAVLRRAGTWQATPAPAAAAPAARPRIQFGPVALDMQAHCLVRQDGTEIALTAMEFDMLQAFAQNPNRVLSRDRLLDLANRSDRDPFDRSIDIRVTRLRRKIEDDPAKPAVIRTVRGTGYMFVPARSTDRGV